MISSVEELLVCSRVAAERELSSSANPDHTILQLGLPFPCDVTSKDLRLLRPIYTHVIKDIREKDEESIFIKKILKNYRKKSPDEAIIMLYFFAYPDMVRAARIESIAYKGMPSAGLDAKTFELLDICDEIACNYTLATFARDAVKNFDSLHFTVLAECVGILGIVRGRSKKFIKNIIYQCKGDVTVREGWLDFRKDLANMLSSRMDLLPNTVAKAILVQAGLLNVIYKDGGKTMIEMLYNAPHKSIFENALNRVSMHLQPHELTPIRSLLGLVPSEWANYKAKTTKPADFREKDVEKTTCDRSGCTKVGSKQCQGCTLVSYCGRECQRKDWKAHKKVCNKVGKVDTSSSSATENARKNKSPALIHQDGILADNKNVDYAIVLLTGNQDIAIIFADPDGKRFFRKMRRLAPDYPVAVILIYEMVSNQRPDKSDLIRSQLRSEYGVDPLGDNIEIDDISSELTDQECGFMAESISAMTKREIITPDKMRQWLNFSRSVFRRLGVVPSNSSQFAENSEENAKRKDTRQEEKTLNDSDSDIDYASMDPAFDGCWSYDCMGLMMNFDSLDLAEIEEEWLEDLEENRNLKRHDEFIELKGSIERRCKERGLHLASGVLRRIVSSSKIPPYVRISRLNRSDFTLLESMKKEANELFSKQRYAEAIEQYEYMLIHPRIQNFFVAPIDQVNVIIIIISNQAECYLRTKDYNAAASTATDALVLDRTHEKSRIRRAKAEIFLYEKEKKSLPVLAQASYDLRIVLNDSNVSSLAQDAVKTLLEKVNEYLRDEKVKFQELDPQGDFESRVCMLQKECW